MHSALWSIAQQLLRQALVAVFMLILTRRVGLVEFGIIGVANICTTFLYLFLELGFAAGLIQRPEITPAHIASAFVLNLTVGSIIALIGFIASGPISVWIDAPDAQPVIATLSICFVITAVAAVPAAVAQRRLQFQALASRDAAANSLAAIIGIILALQDFGVWAVVASSLAVNLISAWLIWRLANARIELRLTTRGTLHELWSYGSKVFSYTALKYFVRTADSIVIGFLFGPEKLGLYNFAQRVTSAPTKSVQLGLAAFIFPRASQLQSDPLALKDLFLLSFKALNYFLLPFSLMLATVGTELLLLVFGLQWAPAVPVIRILIFIQLLAPVAVPLAELLKATNHPNWLLTWTLTLTVLVIGSLICGSVYGFNLSVCAVVAANWIMIPLFIWMLRQVAPFSFSEFWVRLRLSYAIAFVSAASMAVIWTLWKSNLQFLIPASTVVGGFHITTAWFSDPDVRRLPQLFRKTAPIESR